MGTPDDTSPRLTVIAPDDSAGQLHILSSRQMIIGHSDTADIVLDDRFVSRRHALVAIDASGQVTITDLNSTGGTFVNDVRIEAPTALQAGDLVRFADLVVRLEPGMTAAPRHVPSAADTRILPAPGSGAPAGTGSGAPGGGSGRDDDGPDDDGRHDDGTTYLVTGKVLSPALPGIGGLSIELVDKNIGGDHVLATAVTGGGGSYSFHRVISDTYLAERHKSAPDLQVKVLVNRSVLASSQVRYSAPEKVTLDVVLPATAPGLPSEYELLTANLAASYPGQLRELQETSSRQDITYLANKTGWDARAVAVAALADQFSQLTAPNPPVDANSGQTAVWPVPTASVRPEFYYALFRAGVPANPDGVFRTPSSSVNAILSQAASQGVIPPALADEVPTAVQQFQVLSAAHLLRAAPPIGVSTLAEMLRPTLHDESSQQEFAQLYAQHQGNWTSFWTAVDDAFGKDVTTRLQVTGQLYYLTINNEPLVSALMSATDAPLTSLADLASRGFYDPASWAPLIGGAIPAQIPGSNADEQIANYANLMAAHVRLAYPTAVAADQVRRNVLPVAGTADLAEGVTGFLTAQQASFAIGVEPVEAYVARTGLTDTPPEVVTAVKRIQRAYQLTPDDASMAVLLQHNIDSAYAITRYDSAGFTRAFADQLGGQGQAATVYARAGQVFAATLGVTLAYMIGRAAPAPGGQAPVQYGFPPPPPPPDYPVTASATLEDLFGSLDYCACSDCGSILSPAAYLVDLLDYIDQPAPAGGLSNPQDAAFQRRPDLQYLALTCANTNTALPYIDIVNELLEYVVANDLAITGYQGHNTSDTVTSAELIASPQNVNDAAYGLLQRTFFPPPLPFDRPLMLLRAHLASLGVSLPAAMAALRANDDLTATPPSYGWNDILIEQLSISRDEYRLFTDSSLQLGDLYGLPATPPPPLPTLQTTNLQDFSRRTGVSYDDLVSIISTQFVNPNASLIPKIEALNASFATLQQLNQTVNTPQSIAAEFIAALPADLDPTQYGTTDPTDYQAVVNWVTDPANYQRIMSIITITNPSGSADDCSGTALQFRYSNPDNTANLLSGTDFLKIIRFIRLWQKLAPALGDANDATTIQRTDDILSALYPAAKLPVDTGNQASDASNRVLLDAGFTTMLPRTGFLFQVLASLGLTADDALELLLACWSPIGTAGKKSLYARLFLSPAMLASDPGAQTATVASTVNEGDVLHTLINGIEEIPPYDVPNGQDAASVAAAITQAINTSAAPPDKPDPVSGLRLSSRFYASAPSGSGVITIMAGFTLECSVSSGAVVSYALQPGTPVSRSAQVSGTAAAGDQLITTIDGVQIIYQANAGDTPAMTAAGVADAVNVTTLPDPYSGLPLNSLVMASASPGGGITFTAVNSGAPFSLECWLAQGNAGTYTVTSTVPANSTALVSATAQVAGSIPAGTVFTTTVNSLPVLRQAATTDTPATIASAIAAAINATTTGDPVTFLPLNQVVTASAAPDGTVTLTAASATTPFSLAVSISAGGYTAGQHVPPFGDNGYGDYLVDPNQTLFGHEPTICAACNLTSSEFTLITTALGFDASTALSLDTVSQVFRSGWLAHALGLSVKEFMLLRQWTGLGPFALLDPGTTPPTEPAIVRFVRLLGAVQNAGLTTSEALYLLWNADITGTSVPPVATITALATALTTAFAAVDAQFSLRVDPDGSIAQGLMTLVYGTTATTTFFGLLGGTFTTSVGYSTPPGFTSLPQQVIDASGGRLSYDNLAKRLTFGGVLDGTTKNAIDAAITASAPDVAQLTGAVAGLAVANQQSVGPFFGSYPELLPLYTAYVASSDPVQAKRNTLLAGFLPILATKRKQEQAIAAITSAAAVNPSFAPTLLQDPTILHADADVTLPAVTDLVAIENQGLSAQFFLGNNLADPPDQVADSVPELSYFQTATISGPITSGDVLTTTINGVPIAYTVGSAAAAVPPTGPADVTPSALAGNVAAAINAATATNQEVTASLLPPQSSGPSAPGVIVISGTDPSGKNAVVPVTTAVSGGATESYLSGSQLPPGNGGGDIAAIWSGYLAVPQDGLYDFDIATDAGASVSLQLNGAVVPMGRSGSLWSNSGPISLTAGTPKPIVLTASSIKTTFAISWQTQGTGWQPVPAQNLYPATLVNRLGNTYVRFLKATSLASALSLTAPEIGWLGTAATYSVNTTCGSQITPGPATFQPAAMTNIAVGSVLVIDDGDRQETVTVTAVTPATGTPVTFSAVAAKAHDGSAAQFPIISASFAEMGQGWLNFLVCGGWLGGQPAMPGPDQATAAGLASVLQVLCDFARIKRALSPSDGRLLAVLKDPAAQLPISQTAGPSMVASLPLTNSALLSLTGWDRNSVTALLLRFFGSANPGVLSDVANFRRVYDAYTLVKKTGLSAPALLAAITNSPTPTLVSAMQSALRAKYAPADWLTIIGPINDKARISQRDALVAYLLQQLSDRYAGIALPTTAPASTAATQLSFAQASDLSVGMAVQALAIAPGTTVTAVSPPAAGQIQVTLSTAILSSIPAGSAITFRPAGVPPIETVDSLYDYYLIDTQMEPAVRTSRILLALSTVQLFAERVLRNLEPSVSAGDIDPGQWVWMKRYRVWQANREVFLWPENWLYPELRDDQSPIFKQIMGALLQGDVTDDAAAGAYLDYLSSLEEIAKLEPCGLYYVAATASADETSYVVARTAGARRKYYFRELTGGSWTPWAQVQIDCEDMPITPIVWNNRLFLLWLKITKQIDTASTSLTTTGGTQDVASMQVSDVNSYIGSSSGAATTVTAQAVLCWSEYYNGQWQPTKTSDANRPTIIQPFPATGPSSLESCRNLITVVPAQFTGSSPAAMSYSVPAGELALPQDALMLSIMVEGVASFGGFILHNTHSLPIIFDDVGLFGFVEETIDMSPLPPVTVQIPTYVPLGNVLDVPGTSRSFAPQMQAPYQGGYSPGNFGISYVNTTGNGPSAQPDLFGYNWQPRMVDTQPWLTDPLGAPFFYEDRRQVFYVVPTEQWNVLWQVDTFGVYETSDATAATGATGDLVLGQSVEQPIPPQVVAATAATGVPAVMRRYLTSSTDLRAALPIRQPVLYQGRLITPVGSLTQRET